MGVETVTLVGPLLAMVRSGPVPLPLLTRGVVVAVLVKFWADLVPVTEAVLFMVVPLAAVTTPRMVTVQEPPPSMSPAAQLTRFTFWMQLPRVLVRTSWGGTPM